jgi:hypothetical protein
MPNGQPEEKTMLVVDFSYDKDDDLPRQARDKDDENPRIHKVVFSPESFCALEIAVKIANTGSSKEALLVVVYCLHPHCFGVHLDLWV